MTYAINIQKHGLGLPYVPLEWSREAEIHGHKRNDLAFVGDPEINSEYTVFSDISEPHGNQSNVLLSNHIYNDTMAVIPVTVSAKEAQVAIDEALEKVDKQLRELNQFVRHSSYENDG